MRYNIILYTTKIWLTSVLLAPILCFIVSLLIGNASGNDIVECGPIYFLFVLVGLICSFPTWLIFTAAIFIITEFVPDMLPLKFVISVVGVVLTIATCYILLHLADEAEGNYFYLNFMLCNCFCITAGSWIYKLTPKPSTST